MRKSLLIYAGILAGVFALLTLLDSRSQYAAEKIIWKTNKRLQAVSQNPEAFPDRVFEQLIARYQKVAEKFPASSLTAQARLLIGEVYLVRKSYDTARQKFNEVMEKFPDNKDIYAEALSSLGKSYELQNDWENALTYYKRILAEHPLTNHGLAAPLYIARHYAEQDDRIKQQIAYADATLHYIGLTEKYPGTEIEQKSLKLLTDCYVIQEKWPEALETMQEIILKYPDAETVLPLIKPIGILAVTKFHNP